MFKGYNLINKKTLFKGVFMDLIKQKWLTALGEPSFKSSENKFDFIKSYEYETYTVEVYNQSLIDGTFQRVMIAIPKGLNFPLPAVAVPFYFPEAMLGFEPDTNEQLPFYNGIEMMVHLVNRGYITACADTYHLTYLKSDRERRDYYRWPEVGEAINKDHPNWSGVGKLVSDTKRLVDALYNDSRVDNCKIGIAGHSLGGKMAFYTGCLDERVKVILASDFGFLWEQSNWEDSWYWNGRVKELESLGLNHTNLLGLSGAKPFCLLAGEYDNELSGKAMNEANGYENYKERLLIVNHATGHRPPQSALEQGYKFLDKYLKNN